MNPVRSPRPTTVVMALIDAHCAIIDRCAGGMLTRLHFIRAATPHGASDHMGDAPRLSYHPGRRGETAADAAQRARTTARRQFINEVAPIIAGAAAPTEWIILGGNRLFTSALLQALAKSHAGAAIVADNLHRSLRGDTIIARVAAAVDAHLAAQDLADVATLLERTGAHTTGVVGPVASLDAAEHGAVNVVYISPRYRAQQPDDVARLVAATRARGGRVETPTEGAARILDEQAGGVGALLRFALHKMPVSVSCCISRSRFTGAAVAIEPNGDAHSGIRADHTMNGATCGTRPSGSAGGTTRSRLPSRCRRRRTAFVIF